MKEGTLVVRRGTFGPVGMVRAVSEDLAAIEVEWGMMDNGPIRTLGDAYDFEVFTEPVIDPIDVQRRQAAESGMPFHEQMLPWWTALVQGAVAGLR